MCSLGHPREPPPRALLHRLELLPPVDAVPQPLELLHAALVLAALELAERRRRRRRPVLALAEVPAVELPEGEPAVVALGVRQEVGERLVRVAVVVEAAVEPRQVVAAERALAAAVEAVLRGTTPKEKALELLKTIGLSLGGAVFFGIMFALEYGGLLPR